MDTLDRQVCPVGLNNTLPSSTPICLLDQPRCITSVNSLHSTRKSCHHLQRPLSLHISVRFLLSLQHTISSLRLRSSVPHTGHRHSRPLSLPPFSDLEPPHFNPILLPLSNHTILHQSIILTPPLISPTLNPSTCPFVTNTAQPLRTAQFKLR